MILLQQQQLFTRLLARLILQAEALGYTPVVGEVFRPPELARRYAAEGRGSANSLHTVKLAVDLALFRDGTYLRGCTDYAVLGTWWKAQHPLAAWGGDFQRRDGNHFSLRWEGRA